MACRCTGRPRCWADVRPGGVLMSDGYEPYAAIAEQHRPVHLGCWAHCRLYKVEADTRRDATDAPALQQRRAQHSKPLLEQIEALALQHLHGVLPGSLMGKALRYLTAQWPKLVRYADDERYPIDNNACENAIRPFVVGRRNWLLPQGRGLLTAYPSPTRPPCGCAMRRCRPGKRALRRACWATC